MASENFSPRTPWTPFSAVSENFSPRTPGKKMWRCPSCQLLNHEWRFICPNCHSDKPEEVVNPHGGSPVLSDTVGPHAASCKDALAYGSLTPTTSVGPDWSPLSAISSTQDNVAKSTGSVDSWESGPHNVPVGHCRPSVSTPKSGMSTNRVVDGFIRQCSGGSGAVEHFTDASQTVIVFDWDDTLFPTTEFFDEWGLSSRLDEPCPRLSAEGELGMQKWRDALKAYLEQACTLSTCVAIVTSSRRPWVESCIDRFVPELKDMFAPDAGGPLVIYAGEVLANEQRVESQTLDLRPVWDRTNDLALRPDEWEEELTQAKYEAIKLVVTEFYSQYPGQSWKNVISLGDMRYERDATHEVTFQHGCDECRTKTILVPTGPSLSEITLRLRFSRLMLPEYVRFDGDIDLDLQNAQDPLEAIGTALHMKELAKMNVSRHAWGRSKAPKEKEANNALNELAENLENLLVARRAREAGIRWHVF